MKIKNVIQLNILIQDIIKNDCEFKNGIESYDFVDKNQESFSFLKELILKNQHIEYLATLCNSASVAYYLELQLELLKSSLNDYYHKNDFFDIEHRTYKGSGDIDDIDEYTEVYNITTTFIEANFDGVVEEFREI